VRWFAEHRVAALARRQPHQEYLPVASMADRTAALTVRDLLTMMNERGDSVEATSP
jgi:hypothetical protein